MDALPTFSSPKKKLILKPKKKAANYHTMYAALPTTFSSLDTFKKKLILKPKKIDDDKGIKDRFIRRLSVVLVALWLMINIHQIY